jgi:hypothetical protein
MMKRNALFFGLGIAIVTFACSSATSASRTGTTDCGGFKDKCQAGQHCDNLTCVTGCLTDNNCPEGQPCGQDGTCSNGASAPPPSSPCERLAQFDTQCTAASLPSKAYRCSSSTPPATGCKLHPDQVQYPNGYCCP